MRYEEVIDRVLGTSANDWAYNDERGIFVLRSDVDIRIVRKSDEEDREFDEDWATNHPDRKAYRVTYEIYYRASFIDEFLLVAVDGGRAELPLPALPSKVIPRKKYLEARAVDHQGRLDEYISRSKLTVEE